MKLYKFTSYSFFIRKFYEVDEFEMEEKPKTYCCKHCTVKKSEIGQISGFDNRMWLLENNPSFYLKKLLEKNNEKINGVKENLEQLKQRSNMIEDEIKKVGG